MNDTLDGLRMQMVALELKLQTKAKESERHALEEEELTARRLKLEIVHQVQLKKEADLDKHKAITRTCAHA